MQEKWLAICTVSGGFLTGQSIFSYTTAFTSDFCDCKDPFPLLINALLIYTQRTKDLSLVVPPCV